MTSGNAGEDPKVAAWIGMQDKLSQELPKLLSLCGRVDNIKAGSTLLKGPIIQKRLEEMTELMSKFDCMTRRAIISKDYSLVMVPPGPFNKDRMTHVDIGGERTDVSEGEVLCTCSLGLSIEERGVGLDKVFREIESIVVKPKVVLAGVWNRG
jgi:hypothetical protein